MNGGEDRAVIFHRDVFAVSRAGNLIGHVCDTDLDRRPGGEDSDVKAEHEM
jgi:hypothetical protein